MKHTKKLLALLLILVLLCTSVPFAFAEDPNGNNNNHFLGTLYIDEGQTLEVGDNLYYYLNNNVLTISGSGTANYRVKLAGLENENGDTYDQSLAKPLDRIILDEDVIDDLSSYFGTAFYEVSPSNPRYASDEYGVLYNKEKTVLLQYPVANKQTTFVVPDTVTEIADHDFVGAFYLDELILPQHLENPDIYYPAMLLSVTYPENITEIKNNFAAGDCPIYPQDYIIKGMNTSVLDTWPPLGTAYIRPIDGFTMAEFKSLYLAYMNAAIGAFYGGEEDTANNLLEEMLSHIELSNTENGEYFCVGTIHCHAGSTAEAYAIEHGMDHELTHFYEGDWTYDWDNLVRWRKCIHCDERETEPLEAPDTPDTPDTPDIPDSPAKESKVSFILRTVFELLAKLIRLIFAK